MVRRLLILVTVLGLSAGTAPARGAAVPAPNAASPTLYQNIVKLKLDVAQHVPRHGRVGTNDEFMKIFAKTGITN